MVGLETGVRLAGGVALLLANGFFVTTEFAMTRVRQFPREEFMDHPGLERAWEMTERLEIYLSGCQVGITIASVGLGVVAEPAVAAALSPLFALVGLGGEHTAVSVVVALAVINLLHVVVGEQAPTYLGVERSRAVARYGARPLHYWTKLMSPVILAADVAAKWLLSLFGVSISRSWAEAETDEGGSQPSSRGEARARMGETLSGLDLSRERKQEVINALDIDRMTVRDVMVPAASMTVLEVAEPFAVNVERMRGSPHVRFPLVGDDLEDVRGIVYTPAVLRELEELRNGDETLADVAVPPMTVGADTAVSDVIDRFQAERQELAIVREREYGDGRSSDSETTGKESEKPAGSVVGLVTVTDAMEAITGEVEDPLDGAAS